MLTINEKFKDAATGLLIQPLSYERVLETRPQAYEALYAFLIACNIALDDFKFEMGEIKNEVTAQNKAIRDYGGEKKCVTDHVRAKGCVTLPETILGFESPELQEILTEHGIEIAAVNNYFDEPKDQTGYRCLNLKLAVPVNKDHTEVQIVELQVIAAPIEEVYDETHPYKRRAEDAYNEILRQYMEKTYEGISMQRLKEMSDLGKTTYKQDTALALFEESIKPLKKVVKVNFAACRLINARAARGDGINNNFEVLLGEKHRTKHSLNPGKEQRLDNQRIEADMLAEQTPE